MSTSLTYNVQVATGSTNTALSDVSKGVEGVTQKVDRMQSVFKKSAEAAFVFNQISQSISAFSNAINNAVEPGVKLDDSLQDLKAITGATDEQLKLIKQSARDTAIAFGIDAAQGVEAYKLILSQLSPEIAKSPIALNAMGKNVAILSKQLGGDTAGAAGILTTAMNQYGVSLDNPIEATRTMGVMMNIMSKAAQDGSAELPQIKSALEQAGMTAKTFNVSFAETNAAIQVLDKAGKRGAEGGVAIRNILSELALGAKQPKSVVEGFKQIGINLADLSNEGLTFSERLTILKPALEKNKTLIQQLFEKENSPAAIALIQGTAEMDRYTNSVVGTNSAFEMAAIKMDSFQEKMNRTIAKVKDYGISMFDAARPILPFITFMGGAMKFMSDMGGAMVIVSQIANSKFGVAIGKAATATWGFVKSLFSTTLSLIRTAVQYSLTGALILGGFVFSVISATAAQLGFNIAMSANPIGLIVVGIAAAVGAIALLVTKWDFIKEKIVQFGRWVIGIADNIFPGFKEKMHAVFDWVEKKFSAMVGWIKSAVGWIKNLFTSDDLADTTNYAGAIAGITEPNAVQKNNAIVGKVEESNATKSTAESITGGGSKPTNIYVTVGKFQDKIEIHANTFKEGVDDMKRMIQEEFLAMLNSANALSTP
jgi:TP901 family phage tail tape measure protein